MKKNNFFNYSMTMPTIVILATLTLFPLLFTLFYSFTDYYFLSKSAPNMVGFANFVDVLKDPYFRQAVGNTVKFVIFAVVIETILGLLLAAFVNSFKLASKVLTTIVLLPTLMPPVTVALIWQIMFSNNDGVINQILSSIGISPVNWLLDARTAFYAILIIDIWQYVPIAFLLIYATMQSIPQDQYEAASIDGAGMFSKFFCITLPNITSGIIMVILMRTIDSFRLFDKVNILTKGGPANTTATMTQFIYQHGVRGLKVGYGSAASLIMTAIVLVFSVFYIISMLKKSA